MPLSCALLGGFAIGARISLLWQHTRLMRNVSEDASIGSVCQGATMAYYYVEFHFCMVEIDSDIVAFVVSYSSVPPNTLYVISGTSFCRSNDPTNSVTALKDDGS